MYLYLFYASSSWFKDVKQRDMLLHKVPAPWIPKKDDDLKDAKTWSRRVYEKPVEAENVVERCELECIKVMKVDDVIPWDAEF